MNVSYATGDNSKSFERRSSEPIIYYGAEESTFVIERKSWISWRCAFFVLDKLEPQYKLGNE